MTVDGCLCVLQKTHKYRIGYMVGIWDGDGWTGYIKWTEMMTIE